MIVEIDTFLNGVDSVIALFGLPNRAWQIVGSSPQMRVLRYETLPNAYAAQQLAHLLSQHAHCIYAVRVLVGY